MTEIDAFSLSSSHLLAVGLGVAAWSLTHQLWLSGVWAFFGAEFVRVPEWGSGSQLNAVVVSAAVSAIVAGVLLALPIGGEVGCLQFETASGVLVAGCCGLFWAVCPRAVVFLMIPGPGMVAPRTFAPQTANFWFGTNREATFDEVEAVAAVVGCGAIVTALLSSPHYDFFAASGPGHGFWPTVVVFAAGLTWAGVAYAICKLADIFSKRADVVFASLISFLVSMPLFILYAQVRAELQGGRSSRDDYDDDGSSTCSSSTCSSSRRAGPDRVY